MNPRDEVTPSRPEDPRASASLAATELAAPDFGGAAAQARVFAALFSDDAPSKPRELGRYVVLGILGEGGMGTVLEAFDRSLDRRVALKVLRRGLAAQHRERLVREAMAMAKLSHPNVVQVYEIGEANGETFIAMEFLRGQTLRAWSKRTPRPGWRECVDVYLQAGEGLAAAHSADVVHRDFKPSNAFIDERGRVRVLDFGLARRASAIPTEPLLPAFADDDSLGFDTPLTRTGSILGTPAYMPPEQLAGHEADARADQFSFCVALYEALYGQRPFQGSTLAELRVSLAAGVDAAPRGSPAPASLHRIIIRGLAAKPDERWPSMDALLSALRGQLTPRKRGRLAIGAVVGAGLLSLGVARYTELQGRCTGARAELAGVWDDAQRQKLGDAIVATELSYAEATRARVVPRLDDYARRWADKHTEVCEATSVRREQSAEVMDLRMACLRTRRVALAESIAVLLEADATRVEGAVKLVTSLPALERCDDLEALRSTIPLPDDEQTAAEVERLRDQLARVRAVRKAGAALEALELIEPIVTRAENAHFAPLLAEARNERGKILRQTGDPEAAARDFETAYLSAATLRHRDVERSAVTYLATATGYGLRQTSTGLQWGKTALALANDPRAKSSALRAIGAIQGSAGEYDAALDSFRQALEIRRSALGPDHPSLSSSINNVGTVFERWDDMKKRSRYTGRRSRSTRRTSAPVTPTSRISSTTSAWSSPKWRSSRRRSIIVNVRSRSAKKRSALAVSRPRSRSKTSASRSGSWGATTTKPPPSRRCWKFTQSVLVRRTPQPRTLYTPSATRWSEAGCSTKHWRTIGGPSQSVRPRSAKTTRMSVRRSTASECCLGSVASLEKRSRCLAARSPTARNLWDPAIRM